MVARTENSGGGTVAWLVFMLIANNKCSSINGLRAKRLAATWAKAPYAAGCSSTGVGICGHAGWSTYRESSSGWNWTGATSVF